MEEARTVEDYEARGLIGTCYDNLFTIRKRIRKLSEFSLPTRRGLAPNQIAVFIGVFLASVIVFFLLVMPVLRLFGVHPHILVAVACWLVPALLAAQRIVKPMPHTKSISGWIVSEWRFLRDDPVHRRGRPIRETRRRSDERLTHYARVWEPASEFAAEFGTQLPATTRQIETRMSGPVIDLSAWQDTQGQAFIEEERARKAARNAPSAKRVAGRRGTVGIELVHDSHT